MQLFGTLFYANYLSRALALYRSLERHFWGEFELVMLCMDETALRICKQLNLRRARLFGVHELEQRDRDLLAVKSSRTIGEYCWTCTPALLIYLLDQVSPGDTVVYLDADMMFFSSPQPIFAEWADADIAIHEHRFSPRLRHWAEVSGTFNVGWVGIRNSADGRRCLARWRSQCLEACTIDAEHGFCGDQKYLDEWPKLYNVTILQHPGAGLAPWNLENYQLTLVNGRPYVDGLPVIFYHFFALHIVHENLLAHICITPSHHYRFSSRQKIILYQPYAGALRAAEKEVSQSKAGGKLPHDVVSFAELVRILARDDVLLVRTSGRSYPLGSVMTALRLAKALTKHVVGCV